MFSETRRRSTTGLKALPRAQSCGEVCLGAGVPERVGGLGVGEDVAGYLVSLEQGLSGLRNGCTKRVLRVLVVGAGA